jgi:FkbM family methyltransferase
MLISFETLQKKYRVYPKGILHCGANSGEEAEAYDKAGIKKVIWIEANPEVYEILLLNLVKYPTHTAHNVCVSDKEENVTFHIASNGGQSSSFLDLGTHAKNHPDVKYVKDIQVTTKRIDSIGLDLTDVDYLSCDIQGAEYLALKGMGEILRQFKWLYLEVNQEEVYKGNGLVGEIDKYVRGFGFFPVTQVYTRAKWGDKLYIKR